MDLFGETVTTPQFADSGMNYFDIQEIAVKYGLEYNKLCSAIRDYVSKNKKKNKRHMSDESYKEMIKKKGIAIGKAKTTHGYAKKVNGKRNATYGIWVGMRKRCGETASGENRKRYFDRGIRVCERWQEFVNFLEDMGDRPAGMSIERIDNNGNYEPLNCRWATDKEQNRNKSNSVFAEFNGERKTLGEWAEIYGVNRDTIKHRIYAGWSIEKAIKGR